MTLRLDIAVALRNASRRGDLREQDLVNHIKKSLYAFDRRSKPKRVSTGHSLAYLEFAEHIAAKLREPN